MAEDMAQAADGAAQAAADTDTKATDPTQAAGDGTEAISLDEARKLRREAQGLRKRLADFETAEAKKHEAELSEAEKQTKRATELEAQLAATQAAQKEQIVRYEVMLRAASKNVVDPEAAVKLMDLSSLEFDEAGKPINIDKALDALLKQKPYLVKAVEAAAPNVNARNGNDKGDDKAHEEELKRRYRIGG
jgi:hypothetical protein